MKMKQWFSLALGLSLAGVFTGPNLPAAAPATNKLDQTEAARPFIPEPAVAKQDHVNVRGQAAISSEILTHLQKGQRVTVLEEITLKKPKTDEPAKWFRIALPTNNVAWVLGDYIESTNKTVKARRLKLRAGPGENYSVLGILDKGAVVNVLGDKAGWLKIEAPTNAYGFVAAHLLNKEPVPAALVEAKTPAETNVLAEAKAPVVAETKTDEPVAVVQPMAPPTEPPPAAPNPPPAPETNTMTTVAATPPTPPPAIVEPAVTNPPPVELVKRVVTREGILKGMTSIQAPSYFELRSLDNNHLINYVWSPSTNITLKKFRGMRIMVTGEELLDERWPNTPVLSVDTIDLAP